jgi:hypothetical protein
MNFPARFYTGVRNTTIPNPAWLHRTQTTTVDGWPLREVGTEAETFEGLCSEYDFEKQTTNFRRLREVLRANGTDFLYVASAHYRGDLHTNHRFVACSADGSLLWNKYVGFVAQGGQNHVYVAGMRIKVSVFLNLKSYEQRALLGGHRADILAKMNPDKMRYLNEDKTLWN